MMKSLLTAIALLLALPGWAADNLLIGKWAAKQSPVALGGTADFKADGTFALHPDGAGEALGTYTFDGSRLVMRLNSSPQFPAEGIVQFQNKGNSMRIQYANGPAQEFNRAVPGKKAKK